MSDEEEYDMDAINYQDIEDLRVTALSGVNRIDELNQFREADGWVRQRLFAAEKAFKQAGDILEDVEDRRFSDHPHYLERFDEV